MKVTKAWKAENQETKSEEPPKGERFVSRAKTKPLPPLWKASPPSVRTMGVFNGRRRLCLTK